MANAPDPRSTALTELVRILRDQLQQKDERITRLEELLAEASGKAEEREREIVRLEIDAARSAGMQAGAVAATMAAAARQLATPATPPSAAAAPAVTSPPVPGPESHTRSSAPPPTLQPAVSVYTALDQPRVGPMPRKGPAVEEIAASIFAAASEREPESTPRAAPATVPQASWPSLVPAVQRVTASAPNTTPTDEREVTLRFDRAALANGHKKQSSQQGLRKILPWGSRPAKSKQA